MERDKVAVMLHVLINSVEIISKADIAGYLNEHFLSASSVFNENVVSEF